MESFIDGVIQVLLFIGQFIYFVVWIGFFLAGICSLFWGIFWGLLAVFIILLLAQVLRLINGDGLLWE